MVNIFFGSDFYGKKLFWKKILNFTIFLGKNSVGQNVNGINFCWTKFPKLAISWTNILLDKISFGEIDIGKNFLRNKFFGNNYLGKIPLEITHWTFLQCAIKLVRLGATSVWLFDVIDSGSRRFYLGESQAKHDRTI